MMAILMAKYSTAFETKWLRLLFVFCIDYHLTGSWCRSVITCLFMVWRWISDNLFPETMSLDLYTYILMRYDGFVGHICLEKCGMKLFIHSETLMVALMSWCCISDSLFSKMMLTELWDIYTNMLQWVCCEHNILTSYRRLVWFSGSDNLGSTMSWKSKHMFGKVLDEITNPFANFNDCTVDVWELIVISSHTV